MKKSLIIVLIIIIAIVAIDQTAKIFALQSDYLEPIKDVLNIHIAENTNRNIWSRIAGRSLHMY